MENKDKNYKEKTFGIYVRKQVPNYRIYPYNIIGRLTMQFGKHQYIGTGSLISNNVVITCGHNVWERQTSRQAARVTFTPAYRRLPNRQEIGDSHEVDLSRSWIHPDFMSRENEELARRSDIALLCLKNPAPFSRFFKCQTFQENDVFWFSREVSISGYAREIQQSSKQFITSGIPLQASDGMVYHQLDTFGGNSGSPIFYVKDGECRIVAIHTGGDKNTSNWGIRNTQELLNTVKNFADQKRIVQQRPLQITGQEEQTEDNVYELAIDIGDSSGNKVSQGVINSGGFGSRSNLTTDIDQNIAIFKIVNEMLKGDPSQELISQTMLYFYKTQHLRALKTFKLKIFIKAQKNEKNQQIDQEWKKALPFAIQRIQEAAPGLTLTLADQNTVLTPQDYVIRVVKRDQSTGTAASTKYNILLVRRPRIQLPDPSYYKKRKFTLQGTTTHEIMHALGFRHQMERADRNKSVKVDRKLADAQYKARSTTIGLTQFDPYSLLMYRIDNRKMKINHQNPVWKNKKDGKRNRFLSELDKVGLNLMYPPVAGGSYNPKKHNKNNVYYCGRVLHQNSDIRFNVDTEETYKCCFKSRRNCPSCRVLKNEDLIKLFKGGKDGRERWIGWSGRLYCLKKMGKEAYCGPDTGENCKECKLIYRGQE